MQVDRKTDKIKPCECGEKIDEYSIGYGRNPYYISCLGCGKSLHNGTGCIDDFIDLWNEKYRHIHAPEEMLNHKYT